MINPRLGRCQLFRLAENCYRIRHRRIYVSLPLVTFQARSRLINMIIYHCMRIARDYSIRDASQSQESSRELQFVSEWREFATPRDPMK